MNSGYKPERLAWKNMKDRCYLKTHKAFHNYGGRGITVCERWMYSFNNFLEDMGPRPSDKHSLDRIDVNGNYDPTNCRWADFDVQSNNKRTSRYLTFNGKTQTCSQWAREIGIGTDTLHRRLDVYKMPIERALSPDDQNRKWSHGTRGGYDKGCRCQPCTKANADRHRDYMRKRRARDRGMDCAGYIALAGELATELSGNT